MTFKNEYVPSLNNETSDFLKAARSTLRVGLSAHDIWTVDRANDMVLVRTGSGHEVESARQDYWRFADRKGVYGFTTTLLVAHAVSEDSIHLERMISFRHLPGIDVVPDSASISQIRAALQEYKDFSVFSKFRNCELVLTDIDGKAL